MQLSPRGVQAFGALVAVVVVALAVIAALGAPMLDVRWSGTGGGGLTVGAVTPGSPNEGRLQAGERVRLLAGVEVDADLLVEEPDNFDSWTRYHGFLDRQRILARAAVTGELRAILDDGREVMLATRSRTVADLPGLFWLQLAVALLSFLISFGVWTFRRADPAAAHFAVSGAALMLSAATAAIYSTRELIFDGGLLTVLSALNQSGAHLFTSALVMLLWHYPSLIHRRTPAVVVYGVALAGSAAFAWRVLPEPPDAYFTVLALFACSFIFAFVQWRRTRLQPLERAALKWYLLSIYLGTGLFALAILIPAALQIAPPASQGVMFTVFLFMFAGIALGIIRYRLFELDRWWFAAWAWFLGGVAVLLVDVALVSMLHLSQEGALLLSLALLGWVWFPLRQWLWARLSPDGGGEGQAALGRWLEHLAKASDDDALARRWREVLQGDFAPLELREEQGATPSPEIRENGLALEVPDVTAGGHLLLRLPAGGARLFSRGDLHRAQTLVRMMRHVGEAMRARERGVQAERQRIMRDLHDDLGAKLLSLVYLCSGEARAIARAATQDMRDVLTALGAAPCPLGEAVAAWRSEAESRLAGLEVELDWHEADLPAECMLSAREGSNLGRALREALTNCAKHGAVRRVRVSVRGRAGGVEIRVEDDGSGDPAVWIEGNGMRAIRGRVEDLGGEVRWSASEEGACLTLNVPLGAAA